MLADPQLYESNSVLNAFLQYILFFEYESVELIKSCGSVRDDEYSFPILHEEKYSVKGLCDLLELLASTAQNIVDSSPEGDKIAQGIANHLKLRMNIIKGYMLIVYGSFILKPLEEEQPEEEKEEPVQSKGKKKGKKNKKKNKKQKPQKEVDAWQESKE